MAERSNCMASVAFVLSTQDFYLMVQLVKECAGIGIICAPYELQSIVWDIVWEGPNTKNLKYL